MSHGRMFSEFTLVEHQLLYVVSLLKPDCPKISSTLKTKTHHKCAVMIFTG